jgi:DnaJ-class molecular chaperone
VSHPYPPEWDNEPTWVTCPICNGEGCVRDVDLDVTCQECLGDGGWEP